MNPTKTSIALCGVPYRVTEQDGQIIFEDRAGFWGISNCFTFEWRGCGWYLVDFEATITGAIYVPHIAAALEWVQENYQINWIDGTSTATTKRVPALPTPPPARYIKEGSDRPTPETAASRWKKFLCWWSGHPSWTKITYDTWRGVVCGLSYFETCDRCGTTRGYEGCCHETCIDSLLRAECMGNIIDRG